jgi:uncharacterized membrane protein YqaE (UPF0057 family)
MLDSQKFLTLFTKLVNMKKMTTRVLTFLLMVLICSSSVLAASLPADNTAKTEPAPATVTTAVDEFRNLSKHERKSRIKEVKKVLKEYKADKKAGRAADTDIVLLAILAILLPPLAVYLKEGEVNSRFWISLILTLLFWIPGVIFALLIVFDAI